MFIESRLVVQRLCARRRFPSIAITEQHLNRVTGFEAHQVGDAGFGPNLDLIVQLGESTDGGWVYTE